VRSFREDTDTRHGGGHAVLVQTDNTAGNRVVAYRRAADGTLTPAGSYATGGCGGILAGSVVDHTASQGSLAADPRHDLLYAVTAGRLMRAPVLQRAQPRAVPGERDRAAVYGNAADPALGRDVYRIDPVPSASSHA
jgi:hypothetical protein